MSTTKRQPTEPSAIVVPFGKHKGQTVAELLVGDPEYVQWLLGQGWLADRFAELHSALLTRGAQHDDTPEHNALQVRFLDEAFCIAFWFAIDPHQKAFGSVMLDRWHKAIGQQIAGQRKQIKSHQTSIESYGGREDLTPYRKSAVEEAQQGIAKCEAEITRAEALLATLNVPPIPRARVVEPASFEGGGIDVHFGAETFVDERDGVPDHYVDSQNFWEDCSFYARRTRHYNNPFTVEIKPSLGDDFPAVMRQMSRLQAKELLVGSYCGRGASLEQVRDMFKRNNRTLVMLPEVEAELPYAREVLRQHQDA